MLALENVLVLDMNRRYPGAYSAMFLGDFGAEVIKIDPPGSTYPIPNIDTDSEKFTAYFAFDRNKKSIIINLKIPEGRKIFYELIRRADVLIEGFRPGVMERLQADYPTLEKINPRLIYCSLTGFGHDGPYSKIPAHDANYCGLGGILSFIGPKGGPPYLASNFLADIAGAGLHGAIGILIALIARTKTGRGQFIDVAYLDAVISLLAEQASYYFLTGQVPRRGETHNTGAAPWSNIYKCKDGEYITVQCFEPHLWENFCRELGRNDLIPYQNPSEEKRNEIISILNTIFVTKTRDEWFSRLKNNEVCIGPVYYFNETFSDPHVLHRQMVVEKEHQKFGKIRQTGIPIKLSKTPGQIRNLGTKLGFHTNEIMQAIGYADQEIQRLREIGAIS